jgi:uncharacterized membrane protein
LEDLILRALMVGLGLVLVVGGMAFSLESLDSQRAAFDSIALGMAAILIGMCLCVWGLKGIQ